MIILILWILFRRPLKSTLTFMRTIIECHTYWCTHIMMSNGNLDMHFHCCHFAEIEVKLFVLCNKDRLFKNIVTKIRARVHHLIFSQNNLKHSLRKPIYFKLFLPDLICFYAWSHLHNDINTTNTLVSLWVKQKKCARVSQLSRMSTACVSFPSLNGRVVYS